MAFLVTSKWSPQLAAIHAVWKDIIFMFKAVERIY